MPFGADFHRLLHSAAHPSHHARGIPDSLTLIAAITPALQTLFEHACHRYDFCNCACGPRFYQGELIVAVPAPGALCDRFDRALHAGAAHRWGAAAHSYRNRSRRGWCSLLCVDVPAFAPADEICVAATDARARAGRDNAHYRQLACLENDVCATCVGVESSGIAIEAESTDDQARAESDRSCNAGEMAACESVWTSLQRRQCSASSTPLAPSSDTSSSIPSVLAKMAESPSDIISISQPCAPPLFHWTSEAAWSSAPVPLCTCGAGCVHLIFPGATAAPPPCTSSSTNRIEFSSASSPFSSSPSLAPQHEAAAPPTRTLLLTCRAALAASSSASSSSSSSPTSPFGSASSNALYGPDACVVFAFSPRSAHAPPRLLLVRHRKRGFELPGGKVDRVRSVSEFESASATSEKIEASHGRAAVFESAEYAACRELLEEAGVVSQGASVEALRAARARCISDLTPIAQYMIYAPPSPPPVESASHSGLTALADAAQVQTNVSSASCIGDAAVSALGAPHRDACHIKTVFVCRLTLPSSQPSCPAQTAATSGARNSDAGVEAGAEPEAVAEVEAIDTRDLVWLPLPPPSGRHLARAIQRARARARRGSANHCQDDGDHTDDDVDEGDESTTATTATTDPSPVVVSPLLRDAVWDVCSKIAFAEIERAAGGHGRD
jgi:hypothetical protein